MRLRKYIEFIFVLALFGCIKEDVDMVKPIITITTPLTGNSFSVPQNIIVHGSISDDQIVESIDISLYDINNIAVSQSVHITPKQKTYSLNEQIVLNDIHLKGGTYQLTISASDGDNTSKKFIELTINEYPKKRNGLFAFSNNGSNTVITQLDSIFNATFFQTLTGDFLGCFVNSYNQEVVICGKNTGNLVGMDISSKALKWNINNNASGQSHFTGISNTQNEVFIGYYNRTIQSYKSNGTPNYSAQAFVNSYSEQTFVHQDYLFFSEQPEISSSIVRLVVYYMASGLEKQQMIINEDVIDMFSYSENELTIFTNDGGTGAIRVYDVNQNSVWQPFTLNTGLIKDATEITTGIYIIIQNGDLIQVNRSAFTKTTYLSGINAEKVKYDSLTNQLFVVTGSTLKVYDYSSKTLVYTYNHPTTISDFDFWYNK